MVLGSSLFVAGFSVVFVALGTASGALGDWLIIYTREISIVLGSVTILVGIAFLGFVPWMQRDVRVHKVPAVGLSAAPMLGFLFGLGWTPCIGRTLSALAFRRMLGAVAWVRRHQAWVTRIGGIMLIVVGLLLVTGIWDLWVASMRSWVGSFGTAV